MNSAPGPQRAVVVAGEAEQQLGLQRIGVLELVDEDDAEALAELAAHIGVVADQIARLDQQIEEVERAGFLLALFVALQALAHLLVKERGEIGVGGIAKLRAGPAAARACAASA